jgi:hypothetical protein
MGQKFFTADIPRLIKALERIADALEQSQKEQGTVPDKED